jgi:hypothetical protein
MASTTAIPLSVVQVPGVTVTQWGQGQPLTPPEIQLGSLPCSPQALAEGIQ